MGAGGQGGSWPDAVDVEQALTSVYARSDLTPPPPSRLSVWLGQVWDSVWTWLSGLVPDLQSGMPGLRVLAWVVMALLVCVALAALLHVAGVGAAWWRVRVRPGPLDGLPHPDLGVATRRDAAAWEARAQACADAEQWKEAALALYQAWLLRLDARGVVRYDDAKTPGEYRREARSDAAVASRVEAFLRAFEPAAFGMRPLDRASFGRLRALAAEPSPHG